MSDKVDLTEDQQNQLNDLVAKRSEMPAAGNKKIGSACKEMAEARKEATARRLAMAAAWAQAVRHWQRQGRKPSGNPGTDIDGKDSRASRRPLRYRVLRKVRGAVP